MSGRPAGLWAGELDGLVGRDETLATLGEALASAGRTAVVGGIPGAGKTAVLTVVARAEADDGWRVLAATCHASETGLPFAVLIDLLAGVEGAEEVLGLILPGGEGHPVTEPLRLRLAVLALLEGLSEDRDLLLIIDDAHWCDESSLSVIGFVSHRLAGSRISVLVGARGEVAPPALAAHPHLLLAPLTTRDARSLLRRAGVALDSSTLPAVIERAAGNPLALLEMGRAAASGTPQGVPSSVEVAFRHQITGLPAPTREVLLLAACDPALPILGVVRGIDWVLAALAPAEEQGLVEVVDRTVRFRHPLIRSAAHTLAPTVDRLAAHAAIAAAHADDPERAAWHRAEATILPDPEVADAVALAATMAARRGAVAEAARLLSRAAELSPERRVRDQRMLEAILAHSASGDFVWAVRAGAQLRASAEDPWVQVRAAQAAAYALAQTDRSSAARRALLDVLGDLLEVDPFWGWNSLTTLAVVAYRTGAGGADVRHWLEAYDRVSAGGALAMPEVVAAARAWVMMQVDPLGQPQDLLALVREAPVPDELPTATTASHEMLLGATAWLLDDSATAVERLSRAVDLMRRAGAPGAMTQTLVTLALVQFSVGDYDAVDQVGRLVCDMAEARSQPYGIVDGLELRARVAAIRGDLDEATAMCERILLESPVGEAIAIEGAVRVTLSRVRFAENDVEGAWREISWLFAPDGRPRHEHLSYRDLGQYAAFAARSGRADALTPVLEYADRRITDPGPLLRLHLARARALAAGEDAEPWHREALGTPGGPWPFEMANAHLEYGGWLRRRHRQTEAREQLQSALQTFARLGARPWEELARSELRAAGVATEAPRESAWEDLTGQEREVVRLAAAGLTNPEIAAALYLSPRTVSSHLYRAFPKLGVTTRAQLRDVVPSRR